MIHDAVNYTPSQTSNDMVVLRDVIRVKVENKDKIDMKYYQNPDHFVLRFFYKH